MLKQLCILLAGGLALSSVAYSAWVPVANFPSQVRRANESFEEALERYRHEMDERGVRIEPEAVSAIQAAVPFLEFRGSKATAWDDSIDAEAEFAEKRDLRFIALPEKPGFPRRISWLYPDDGCFARATMMSRLFEESGLPRPKRLFIFGNLAVQTPNAPSGSVGWWYHVVPVVSQKGKLLIFDPSIDPSAPMSLTAWVKSMTRNPNGVKLALCNTYAYEPGNSCDDSKPRDDAGALSDQETFLRVEWNRLAQLGRDPEDELGSNPPWKREAVFQARESR